MTPEEAVNASVEARIAAQDDMGTVNLDQAIEKAGGDVELALSEPIRGVHDLVRLRRNCWSFSRSWWRKRCCY